MGIPERWARFRELPPNIRQTVDQLIPLFEQEQVQLAYLFGSLSRGEGGNLFRQNSQTEVCTPNYG